MNLGKKSPENEGKGQHKNCEEERKDGWENYGTCHKTEEDRMSLHVQY